MANTLELGNGKWATGKDTVLAFNDQNNNFKPLPFSFSRASSATVVNKDGLIETVGSGEPRIDFKDNTKGALLLEPQRSNLVNNSNFQSGWSVLSGGSINQNQSISPDGTQNATILSGNGVNPNAAYTFINVTTQEYTYSMFAKKGSEYILRMIGFSGGANGNVEFNLNNGTIETPSDGTFSNEKIEDYGNGWYRCSVKVTVTSSGSKTFGFNREAIVSGDLFSVYGVQLEEGSYATSYIPTSGSAVTRVADVCNNGGNEQVINSTEGVLYAEISAFEGSDDTFAISLNDGSSSNRIFLSLQTPESRYRAYSTGGGDVTFQGLDVTSLSKVAVRYSLNNFSLWVNGVKRVETLTYAGIPSNTLNNLSFDRNGIGELDFRGNVKDLKLYNTALTDQELIALTTI
jgi:hypothetical protein